MLSAYKNYFEPRLQGLAKTLRWINPNVLTLIGIIPQALFFILMQKHLYGLAAFALVFSVFDMLDGLIARMNNKTSRFGAFLDSTIDRISDFIIISAFYASGIVGLKLTALLVLASFLSSYARSRGELASGGEIKFNIGLIERTERIVILFLIVVFLIIFPNTGWLGLSLTEILFTVLVMLSFYTFFQRVWYAYKKL